MVFGVKFSGWSVIRCKFIFASWLKILFGQCFTNVREKYIDMLSNLISLRDITAVSFSWKNSTYLARHNIIHKINSVKTWYFDKIKSSRKLMITFFFVISEKFEFDFGCGPCCPCFCLNRALEFEKQFLKVWPIFFFQNSTAL